VFCWLTKKGLFEQIYKFHKPWFETKLIAFVIFCPHTYKPFVCVFKLADSTV